MAFYCLRTIIKKSSKKGKTLRPWTQIEWYLSGIKLEYLYIKGERKKPTTERIIFVNTNGL